MRHAAGTRTRARASSRSAGDRSSKGGKVVLRPGTDRDVYDKMLDGRPATIERIYHDYEDGVHIAVTVDGEPEQELFRETGRYLFFNADEVEAGMSESEGSEQTRRSSIAGHRGRRVDAATTPLRVGKRGRSAFGGGGDAARPSPASAVLDFGTGGLDLAYEVMRGYDALVLVDVSQPGRRARDPLRDGAGPGRRSTPIDDGEVVNPHGMDPQTVLRFVKTVGGWPGEWS